MTDTPNAPTPTTPATAEELRAEAAQLHLMAESYRKSGGSADARVCESAAAALDAEAARREASVPETPENSKNAADAARFRWLADRESVASLRFSDAWREWNGVEDIRAAFDRVMARERAMVGKDYGRIIEAGDATPVSARVQEAHPDAE